jgi:Fe2+ transport system protein FeoA
MGMGLYPGAKLKLVDRLPDGTTIVEISGTKAAIAAQIAQAIFIRLEP